MTRETLAPLPTKVKLTKTQSAALKKLNDKTVAVNQFVGAVTAQGESRIAELQVEGRKTWSEIAEAHNLDLNLVNYVPSDDGDYLLPVGMKLDSK